MKISTELMWTYDKHRNTLNINSSLWIDDTPHIFPYPDKLCLKELNIPKLNDECKCSIIQNYNVSTKRKISIRINDTYLLKLSFLDIIAYCQIMYKDIFPRPVYNMIRDISSVYRKSYLRL